MRYLIIISALLNLACGQSEFKGNQGARDAASADAISNRDNTVGQPMNWDQPALHRFDPNVVFDNSEDGNALKKCFSEWGETPFTAADAKVYRTLSADTVGFTAKTIADRARSVNPSLILVKVKAQGFSKYDIDLGNPNGWYCLATEAVGFSSFSIRAHCRATLGNVQSRSQGFAGSDFQIYGDEC